MDLCRCNLVPLLRRHRLVNIDDVGLQHTPKEVEQIFIDDWYPATRTIEAGQVRLNGSVMRGAHVALSNLSLLFWHVHNEIVEKGKLPDNVEEALVPNLYKTLKASSVYADYLHSSNDFDATTDLELIHYIYKTILLESEDFHAHLQDCYSKWIDDAGFISTSVLQTIEKSKNKLSMPFEKDSYDPKMNDMYHIIKFPESVLIPSSLS